MEGLGKRGEWSRSSFAIQSSVGRPRREEEDGGIVILINKADEKKKVRGDFVHNVAGVQTNGKTRLRQVRV